MKKSKNKSIYGLYLSEDYFTFYVTHKNGKVETASRDYKGNTVIIQTHKTGSSGNERMSVHCWYGPVGCASIVKYNMVDTDNDPIYDSGCEKDGSLPWEYGISYEYRYDIKNKAMKVRRLLTEKEGLEILAKTPHRLTGWDPTIQNYDIQCACGEYMSNPCDGRVKEIEIGTIEADDCLNLSEIATLANARPAFLYNGKCYERLRWQDWHTKRFMNRAEYEATQQIYKNDSNFDIAWPDFDTLWVRLNKLSSEEVIEANSVPAAGWRDPNRKTFYFNTTPRIGAYEKVVSKGWMTEPAPGTIKCPCCDDLHRVYSETSCYIPWYRKIKRNFIWRSWPLEKFFKDLDYRISKLKVKLRG